MAVTIADLRVLAPELSSVDDAILTQALAAVPLTVNLARFSATGSTTDLLTKYMALHILSLMGFGRQANGRVISKSAAGVSVTYAQSTSVALGKLESTPWGVLYRQAVRQFGLRGAVT